MISYYNQYLYYFRASVSEAGDEKREGPLKKYHVEKSFADRRYKVSSARTYFYLNEASCERNMDIFVRCLEAVAGELVKYILTPFNILIPLESLTSSPFSLDKRSRDTAKYIWTFRDLLIFQSLN